MKGKRLLRDDSRCHEDKQFPFTHGFVVPAEQLTQTGNITKQWDFIHAFHHLMLEYATQNDSFAIIHKNLSSNTLGVNRHRFAGARFNSPRWFVLGYLQVQYQFTVRVICGVTDRLSTAFLNDTAAAPLEDASR